MKNYQILESTSELKIRVFGNTISDLFRTSLVAMFECIEPTFANNNIQTHPLEIKAPNPEILLVDFLSESLFYADTHKEAFFDVVFFELSDQHLKAQIFGKPIESFSIEIKAVTYHDVHIVKKQDKLTTDLIFDI